MIQPAFATSNTCPCIVFRFDDVQGYYLRNVQMKVLNEFEAKNASLTIGVIGYDFNPDKKLVSYIQNDLKKGHSQIEIANHGWKHENFADLTESQQIKLLNNTNQELLKTFGKKPTVFITPYNLFNNYTLKALQHLKMNVISSGITEDMNNYVTAKGKIVLNKDAEGLYHMPSTTDLQIDVGNETSWTNIPKDKVISSINSNIKKIGYSVVLLHPQNFAKLQNGTYVDTVDDTAINELGSLIDYAKSKHIRITTLSNIVGFGLQKQPIKLNSTNATIYTATKKLVPILNNTNVTRNITPNNSSVSNITSASNTTSPTGVIQINMKYPSGDLVEYQLMSMRVYQDSNPTPYQEIKSISGNPFTINSLPIGHRYKIEAYDRGMLSGTDYVNLENPQQEVDMGIADGGSLRATVLYDDDQTPISNATVIIKSQDNKTRETGNTDPNGQTVRFYLASTNVDSEYYTIQVKIGNHLSYSYMPTTLLSGNADEIRIVTPWPSEVNSLITVRSYDLSKILTSSNGNYVVDLFDYNGNELSTSKINIHGDAYFWNLKVGDYVFKTINGTNGSELGTSAITLDGSKTNFDVMIHQNKNFKTESVPQNAISQNNLKNTSFLNNNE